MKPSLQLNAILVAALGLASCAQPSRIVARSKAPETGARFASVGKVTLHQGQPCASQIMFDFHSTGKISTIWLGAPMRESGLLTDAADRKRRIRIWGNWKRDPDGNCDYVTVTRVEPLSMAVVF